MSILNGKMVDGDWIAKNAINAMLSGGNPTAQIIVPLNGWRSMSLVENFNSDATHTLVASLALDVSNDYDDLIPNPLMTPTWDPVTDAAILAWLSTDAAATPKGGKPNGVAGTGSLVIDPLAFSAFRFTVTQSAGTGLYILGVKLAGNGRK